jgi:hypothetical protein
LLVDIELRPSRKHHVEHDRLIATALHLSKSMGRTLAPGCTDNQLAILLAEICQFLHEGFMLLRDLDRCGGRAGRRHQDE